MRSKSDCTGAERLGYVADLVHSREQECVKYFGALREVETFDVAILGRLAGLKTAAQSLAF
jgi:hypothetical protein